MRSAKILRDLSSGVAVSTAPIGAFAPTAAQAALLRIARAIPIAGGAVRNYGAIALTRMRAAPVDFDYHGLTLRFYPTMYASARHMLFTPRASERAERAFLLRHLPADGVFVDVGANAGFFAFAIAAARPAARVLAFEPIERYASVLAFNIAANRLSNVALEAVALSDQDGEMAFSLATQSLAYGEDRVIVPTRRLDTVLAQRGLDRVDALKIDVEGAEDLALLPFYDAAPRAMWPRAVLIEDCFKDKWRRDCVAFLKERGYRQEMRGELNLGLALDASSARV